MNGFIAKSLLAGLLVLGALPVRAQSYSIDWFKIAGGGDTSTGGVYSVSGTIGQHDASGPMSGGNFSLTGGFWALTAVQTPGAPRLTVQLTPTNTVVVLWPLPSTGFTLQQSTDVSPTNWEAVPETVTDNSTNRFVIISPLAGNRFYRLFKP